MVISMKLLEGKKVAQALDETMTKRVEELKKKGAEMLTEPFDTDLAENTDGE